MADKINGQAEFPIQLDEFYLELQADGNSISPLNEDKIVAHPFPGLRPFKTSEFQLFKGRDGQADELIKRLKKNRFLAVIGSSGTGKSSLVRAGLIPQLLGGYLHEAGSKWDIAICRPGSNPIENLAVALTSVITKSKEADEKFVEEYQKIEPVLSNNIYGLLEISDRINNGDPHGVSTNLLVIIDQFEELIRFDRRKLKWQDVETHFVNLLLKAVVNPEKPIFVIITMRSEFLGDCVKYRGLPEAINEGQYLVPQLGRTQVKEVIVGPISMAGKKISPELVELLINELEQKKLKENLDQLPILQHALMSTYANAMEHGPDTLIGIDNYKADEIGGMTMALANHAEEKYKQLGNGIADDQNPSLKQKIAKIVFQTLTELSPDQKGGRRPAELKSIYGVVKSKLDCTEQNIDEVINTFRDDFTSFIMPPISTPLNPGLMLDISHESLMRNWPRLKGWVDNEYESANMYEHLVESASLNRQNNKDFLREKELQYTLKWLHDFQPNAEWAKRYDEQFKKYDEQFKEKKYNASFNESMAYLQKSKNQWIWKRQRKYWIIGGSTVLFAALWFLVTFGLNRLQTAFDFNSRAEKTTAADPTFALRQAEYALQQDPRPKPSPIIQATARQIYAENAFYKTIISGDGSSAGNRFISFALSRDGNRILTGSADSTARLWNTENTHFKVFKGQNGTITSVAFSPDGTKILTGAFDGSVWLWDTANNQKPLRMLNRHKGIVKVVAMAENGTILTGATDDTAHVWLPDGSVKSYARHAADITDGAISPDGTEAITSSADNSVRLWHVKGDWDLLIQGTHHQDIGSGAVAFSRDGTKIIIGSRNGIVKIIKSNGDSVSQSQPLTDAITSVAFSPDGTEVLVGSSNQTAVLSTLYGTIIKTLRGKNKGFQYVGFGGDDKKNGEVKIFTGSNDNKGRFWYMDESLVRVYDWDPAENDALIVAKISPAGDLVFTGSANGFVRIFDMYGNLKFHFKAHRGYISSLEFSPTGKTYVTGSGDATVRLWNINGDSLPVREFKGHKGGISSVAFSRNEKFILTGSADSTARVWNVDARTMVKEIKGDSLTSVLWVGFSSSGDTILTGSQDTLVRVWKNNGSFIKRIRPRDGEVSPLTFAHCADSILVGHTFDQTSFIKRSGYDQLNITAAVFSPHGDTILTGSNDNIVRLSGKDGTLFKEFRGHTKGIISVGFSPNGKKIITCSSDRTVRIWDVDAMSYDTFLKSNKVDVFRLTK